MRDRFHFVLIGFLGLLLFVASPSMLLVEASSIATGKSSITLDLRGKTIPVFLYKPESYKRERILVVMHGVNRNAEEYRDHAENMGDRFGALIVAPLFDARQFPSVKYQRGGVVDEENQPQPREEWTYLFISEIVNGIRDLERKQDIPFYVIGHSAGGQFVVRMSAFLNTGAKRLVASNPGSLIFPTRDRPFGYGFGGLPSELSSDEQLKNFLSVPLTLYVGTNDNKPDEYFDGSEDAMKQGGGRYQRSHACFEMAKRLAEEKGWPFAWRIVDAPGIGHDHERMFNHELCEQALFAD
jgi:pimeloyl-ACP methyl ester carboxylesterase